MSLDSRLEPREVLPYTDEEIREMYFRARFGQSDVNGSLEQEVAQRTRDSTLATVEVVGITVLVYALVAAGVNLLWGFESALWVSAFAFIAVGLLLAQLASKIVIGPFSWLARRNAIREVVKERLSFNPLDPSVLETVVRYIADEPLSKAQTLRIEIEQDLKRIDASLVELPELALSLRSEIAATNDDGMRTLLESKHATATATIHRLQQLAEELARQLDEVQEAVRPIHDLCLRFDHIQRLSSSLARIQAAHGLIEESEQRLEDHRIELKLLRVATASASAKLQEIESIVHAHEQARAEIQSLSE